MHFQRRRHLLNKLVAAFLIRKRNSSFASELVKHPQQIEFLGISYWPFHRSSAQRAWITNVTFVEIHVCLGQIGGVNHCAGFAKIQVDV